MPSNYDESSLSKEERKIIRDLKILTAISLGKDRNKEIANILDTDKSFASKKVKKLCDEGLVFKEGEGKETRYRINPGKVLRFLQSRVIIKWKKKEIVDELKNNMK